MALAWESTVVTVGATAETLYAADDDLEAVILQFEGDVRLGGPEVDATTGILYTAASAPLYLTRDGSDPMFYAPLYAVRIGAADVDVQVSALRSS